MSITYLRWEDLPLDGMLDPVWYQWSSESDLSDGVCGSATEPRSFQLLTGNLVSERLALSCPSVKDDFLPNIIDTELQDTSSIYLSAITVHTTNVRTGIINQGIETFNVWFDQFLQCRNVWSVRRGVSECPLSRQGSESSMVLGC